MNMVDTKKCFRGILFWREDVIKCAKIVKKPLSEFVRDLLHTEMQKHRLDAQGNRILREQIAAAYEERKGRKARGKGRTLMVDRVDIPAKVRKNPVFVKEK